MLEVLLDMQLTLIQVFGWSLADIDRTDAVSLFDLMRHIGRSHEPKQVFADEVEW
jgi:hypothetical protein